MDGTLLWAALALLTGDARCLDCCWSYQVREVALAWEIMDAREVNYYLVRHDEYASDLKCMHQRWVDLREAPPLSDAACLPPSSVSRQIRDGLRESARWAEETARHYYGHPAKAQRCLEFANECRRRATIWDLMADAAVDGSYVTARREYLRQLREQLGPQRYYKCDWPSPVVGRWQDGMLYFP